ncbi:MAG: hypothetical protein AAB557_04640 [Patescibacteria group bacterium]
MSLTNPKKVKECFPCSIGGASGVCIYTETRFGCCGLNDNGDPKGCFRAVNYLEGRMNARGDTVPYTLFVYDDSYTVSVLKADGRGFFVEKGHGQEIM